MKNFLTVTTVACIAALFFTSTAHAQIAWSKVYSNSLDVSAFCETSTNMFGELDGRLLMKSTNKGASWARLIPTSGYPTANYSATAAYQNNLYLVNYNLNPYPPLLYQGKGFFLSTDQGANWVQKNNGLGNDTVVGDINVTKNGTIFITAVVKQGSSDRYKIYRSTDNGSNWAFVLQLSNGYNSFLENSAGTYFLPSGTDNMYQSTDGGVTWTLLTQTVPNAFGPAVIASNDSIYMISGVGMQRSKDGKNWTAVNRTGWPSATRLAGAFLTTPRDTLYATIDTSPATDFAVYMSPDLGKTWSKVITGLSSQPQIPINQIWLSKNTGYLFATPYGSGTYRTTKPVYTYVPEIPTSVFAPADYSDKLGLTISPNPATEITTIEYTLGSSDFVSIEITDQSGNVVKTVLNQSAQSAGTHKQTLELNGIKAGLYFVSVNSSNGRSVKKIIVH
jgi:photosystem II stability/assembly factor-like uncharacterized protein